MLATNTSMTQCILIVDHLEILTSGLHQTVYIMVRVIVLIFFYEEAKLPVLITCKYASTRDI